MKLRSRRALFVICALYVIVAVIVCVDYRLSDTKPPLAAWVGERFGYSTHGLYLTDGLMFIREGAVPGNSWNRNVLWAVYFGYDADHDGIGPHRYVSVPVHLHLWIASTLAGVWIGLLAWRFARGRRHPPGHCAACGYNLTGNTSGICSECGSHRSAVKGNERSSEMTSGRGELFERVIVAVVAAAVVAVALSIYWDLVWYVTDIHSLLISGGCTEWIIWPDDWRDRYSAGFRPGGIRVFIRHAEAAVSSWWVETGEYQWGRKYVRLPIWMPIVALVAIAVLIGHRSRASAVD